MPRPDARSRVAAVLVPVTLLAAGLLTGCSDGGTGSSSDAGSPPSGAGSSDGLVVTPQVPHVDGPVEVSVLAGLRVLSDDPCGRSGPPEAVCTEDGAHGWVPYAAARGVRLLAAEPQQDAERDSWSLVLRFEPAAAPDLRAAMRGARTVGGEVLVLAAGTVRAELARPDRHGSTLVLTGLDKPTAWSAVEAFGPG